MEIRLYATFRALADGERRVEVPAPATVAEALATLAERFPALGERLFDEDGAVRPYVAVMVDGRDIRHLDGLATPLTSAQAIDLFPPVAGGAA